MLARNPTPAPQELGVSVHTYNLCTQKVEAERSRVQGQPFLQNEFEASLSYMRLYVQIGGKG